jgi:ATP-binding cassette, subfamily B, multidrug efflux pump
MKLSEVVVSYLKKHIVLIIVSALIIAADVALTLLPPIILKYIVDDVILGGKLELLLKWSLLYTASFVLYGVFEFFKTSILIKVSQGICKELRLGILQRVHTMSYEKLSSYESGSIESYLNNDVNTINNLVSEGVISMMIDVFKMIGVYVSVFFFSVPIGYVILGISPFIAAFVLIVRKRMFKAKLKSKQMESDVNQRVLENIENIETVQTYNAYDYVNNRYNEILMSHFAAQRVSFFYDSLFSPVMQFLRYALIAVIIIISVYNPSAFGITVGTLLSLADLLSALFTPMENIGMELQTLQDSVASIHRINSFVKPAADEIVKKKQDLGSGPYVLEYKNVNYAYTKEEKVITDFSLVIKPGERLTLKGESGVGKSTLFKLGYGLLTPVSGQVLINGLNVSELSDEARRRVFGIVYQDPFFSGGTIREEITLGSSSFTDQQIFAALSLVGLERIKDLDIKLKESDYSSGELALFNIARVLIRNPEIIFLDEMNAKIDPATALKIINILDTYEKDRTVLSITHYGTQLKNSKELILKASV